MFDGCPRNQCGVIPMKLNRVFIGILVLALSACSKTQPPAASEAAASHAATIKDIMDSMVDPSADFLFESMAEIADADGVRRKAPQTDEEWKEVRRRALVLVEAPNLLIMEGRRVAKAGEKAENPEVELHPEQIEAKMAEDRPSF